MVTFLSSSSVHLVTFLSSLSICPFGYFSQFLVYLSIWLLFSVPCLSVHLVTFLSSLSSCPLGWQVDQVSWPLASHSAVHSSCVCLPHYSRVAAFRHHDVTVPCNDIPMYLIDQHSSRYREFLKPLAAATGCHKTVSSNTHRATFQVLTAVLL